MSADDTARQLHDQATRGGVLSTEEQTRVAEWYARQDRQENAALAQNHSPDTMALIRDQITEAVSQLTTVTQRIQALTAENEAVRRQVGDLYQQFLQQSTMQSA